MFHKFTNQNISTVTIGFKYMALGLRRRSLKGIEFGGGVGRRIVKQGTFQPFSKLWGITKSYRLHKLHAYF